MRGKGKTKLIRIASREATLKRKIRRHLHILGFRKSDAGDLQVEGKGKDVIRALHSSQREDRLNEHAAFIADRTPALLKYFASGQDIDPIKMSPVLERIFAHTWQADLFRLASLTWSVPVSNGYGRRLRYLVWDRHNEKLIGLIAIGDPVFNLSVRDNLIEWNVHDREARLVNVMDAYVLGALPPYSALLAGKMVACLVRSREIYDDFARIYGGSTGIIPSKRMWSPLKDGPSSLCKFVLTLATQPYRIHRTFGSELVRLLNELSSKPAILRGARFLALLCQNQGRILPTSPSRWT